MELKTINLSIIDPHPRNPREKLGDLTRLAASIKAIGLITPVAVRPHPIVQGRYQLEAGHRRSAAARIAGLTEVPAYVADHGDDEAFLALIAENELREDLTPEERSAGWQGVLDMPDLESAAAITGADVTVLRNAQRGKQLVDKAKLQQASLEELATLMEFEDTPYLRDLETHIGRPDFTYYTNVYRAKLEKAIAIEESELVAGRMGIHKADIDHNTHLALVDAVDDDGPMTEEKLADLIVTEKLDPEACGYYIYEHMKPYVRYFIEREAAKAAGIRSRYERFETDEERAAREAKEAAKAAYNDGFVASRDARRAHLIANPLPSRRLASAILSALKDRGMAVEYDAEVVERMVPESTLPYLLYLAADDDAFNWPTWRDMNADEARTMTTWLEAVESTGYTITPWEADRVNEAKSIIAEDEASRTCAECAKTEDECVGAGSSDPACADFVAGE